MPSPGPRARSQRHPGEIAERQRAHRPSTAARNSLSSRLASGRERHHDRSGRDKLGQAAIELRHAAAHPPLVGATLDRGGRGEDARDHARRRRSRRAGRGPAPPPPTPTPAVTTRSSRPWWRMATRSASRSSSSRSCDAMRMQRRGPAQLAHDVAEPLGPERIEPWVGSSSTTSRCRRSAPAPDPVAAAYPWRAGARPCADAPPARATRPCARCASRPRSAGTPASVAWRRSVDLGGPAGRQRQQLRADTRRRGAPRTRAAAGPRSDLAAGGCEKAEQDGDQRGLAGAVRAGDADDLTAARRAKVTSSSAGTVRLPRSDR